MSALMSIDDAREKILKTFQQKPAETKSVTSAVGRVLAADVYSPINLPAFANSSMDGFALRSIDVEHASSDNPISLPVQLDIPAGFNGEAILAAGTAARILTGAPIPEGADSVIPVENTDQFQKIQNTPCPKEATFFSSSKPGDNIRLAGEDLKKGQLVLKKNQWLRAQEVGLLISMGYGQIDVLQKPRVALLSSGDELLQPGEPLSPGKIYDANRFMLSALIQSTGAEVIDLGICQDTPQSVKNALNQVLLDPPDLIVSSAGVSVGAFDYVRQVIEENGTLSFWRVNMRPGKPVAFGHFKQIPFLGLPGNPVSAYVGCKVFVEPIIRKLQGQNPLAFKQVHAVLDEPLISDDGRESFYRGVLHLEQGIWHASLTGHQGSGNLFSLVQADAFLIVPSGVKKMEIGEEVSAWLLD